MHLSLILLLFFLTTTANACPFCRSDTSEIVRAGIFNDFFFSNLFIAGAPFVLFLAIAAFIHFGPWDDVLASFPGSRFSNKDKSR